MLFIRPSTLGTPVRCTQRIHHARVYSVLLDQAVAFLFPHPLDRALDLAIAAASLAGTPASIAAATSSIRRGHSASTCLIRSSPTSSRRRASQSSCSGV